MSVFAAPRQLEVDYSKDEGSHIFVIQEFPKLGATECVGFHLFDSSILLAKYLALELKPCLLGKRNQALELGSGCSGLPGIALSWLDYDVTFTDIEAILPYLKINVERNAKEPSQHKVTQLLWGEVAQAEALGKFDLVVGADVVYLREHVKPLLTTISICCKREAFICCERREEGLVEDYFVSEAKSMCFQVKRIKNKFFPSFFSFAHNAGKLEGCYPPCMCICRQLLGGVLWSTERQPSSNGIYNHNRHKGASIDQQRQAFRIPLF